MGKPETKLKPRTPSPANALKAAGYARSQSLQPGSYGGDGFSASWFAEAWLYGADRGRAQAVLDGLVSDGELAVEGRGTRLESYRLPESPTSSPTTTGDST